MATVTIRMDDEEKTMLDHLLDDIGMNISTFYMIYTKRFLRERKIPFEIGSPDPFHGEGQSEPLKGGNWSRRINEKDRLVYEPTDGAVIVKQCKGHYGDK